MIVYSKVMLILVLSQKRNQPNFMPEKISMI